jgi:hypothetical protein
MDRVRARLPRRAEERVLVEVGAQSLRGTDADGLVHLADVERALVGVGVDGNGGDAQHPAGAGHAHRDLPAVRDQDLPEEAHGAGPRGTGPTR